MIVTRKIKRAGVTSALRAGLTIYGSFVLEHRKVSVVLFKRVNFRENISPFRRKKRNFSLYTGVRREGGGWVPLYLQCETAIPNYT